MNPTTLEIRDHHELFICKSVQCCMIILVFGVIPEPLSFEPKYILPYCSKCRSVLGSLFTIAICIRLILFC